MLNLLAGILLLLSCKQEIRPGMIIITRIPQDYNEKNYITGEFWRYIPNSQLVAIDIHNRTKKPIILTKDFFSARSPEVSYDGKRILFAAQQTKESPWQIWEMNLSNHKTRLIIALKENCTDLVYLPGNRMAFSKWVENDVTGTLHQLFTCNLDGSDLRQITYHPHANFASTILNDGRILCISRQLYPEQGDQIYMVMRPDGTKADMFYKGAHGVTFYNRARETNDGRIYFIESEKADHSENNIAVINLNRPLFTKVNLTSQIHGIFHAVLPFTSEKLLVTFKPSEKKRSALYEFNLTDNSLSRPVYDDSEYEITEVALVNGYNRPKKLPSEVDFGVKTGLIMCQNINLLNTDSSEYLVKHIANRIEVIGIDTAYGRVHVEKDGSFYLKVIADMPFRVQTLDENGNVLNGPGGWVWLRPNERRGCVGCHEDYELVPENKVPMAVEKPPVIIPQEISEITEKEVELE